MAINNPMYPARLAARSHLAPSVLGWSQATVLFLDIERTPSDEGVVADPTVGYDVTPSMNKLLETETAIRRISYHSPAYPPIECDGRSDLGGGPLKRAVVLADDNGFTAVLPDGRKEDVTKDARAILAERLQFVVDGHPENPRLAYLLARDVHFVVPAPGSGVELRQSEMTGKYPPASTIDVAVWSTHLEEISDLLSGIDEGNGPSKAQVADNKPGLTTPDF